MLHRNAWFTLVTVCEVFFVHENLILFLFAPQEAFRAKKKLQRLKATCFGEISDL